MANFQNIVPKRLAQASSGAAYANTSYASIYTVPSGTRTFVKDMDICNTTGSSVNVIVCFVPAASTTVLGTPGVANAIYYNVAIAANTTLQWKGTQILNGPADNTQAGDTIQFKASAAGVTITISGGEAT